MPGTMIGVRSIIASKNKYKSSSKNFPVSGRRQTSNNHTDEVRCSKKKNIVPPLRVHRRKEAC